MHALARHGRFGPLAGHKYCQLVTFRRSGKPVPTPMWFALDGDRIYMKTEAPSGKVKRIRRQPRVTVAPCTIGGRRLDGTVEGVARILPATETGHAEQTLRRRYGFGRWLFTITVEPVFGWLGRAPVYIEVTP